jgi:hypothetical protein
MASRHFECFHTDDQIGLEFLENAQPILRYIEEDALPVD